MTKRVVIAAAALVLAGLAAWPLGEQWAARILERRLSAETGLPWTVGRVALDPLRAPHLIAHDLSSTKDGTAASIRRLRLDDLWSARSVSGKVHVVAEGVDLSFPTDRALVRGAADAPAGGIVTALDAIVRAPRAALSEDRRRIALAADEVDLTAALADPAPKTDLRARLELAGSVIEIGAAITPGEPVALTAKRDPRGNGTRIDAKATARLGSDGLRLDGVAGTVGDAAFSGSGGLLMGAKPRLTLDAKLDALTLVDAGGSGSERMGTDGLILPVDPDLLPDVRWFEGFEAKGSITIAALRLGDVRLDDVAMTGTVQDGRLDAALSSAGLYEGQARGRYVLGPDATGVGRHQLSASLARVRVRSLLTDAIGLRGLDGSGALRLDMQGTGNRTDDLLRSLSGSADLSVTDGRIDGLDLAGSFGLTVGGERGRLGGLATRLDRLAGRFDVIDGQAVTNDLTLKTALIETKGVGRLDLVGRTLDFRFKPQVAGASAEGMMRTRLDVPVRVSGPWANPDVSADLSGLAENPAGAMQSLQDLGSKLLGEDGGELGESLGGLIDSFIPRSGPSRPERGQPGRRQPPIPE